MSYEHDFKCVTTAIQCTFKHTLIYVHTTFQKILIAIFRQGGTLIFPYHDTYKVLVSRLRYFVSSQLLYFCIKQWFQFVRVRSPNAHKIQCALGDLTRTKLKSLFYAKIKQLTTLKVLVKVFLVYSSTQFRILDFEFTFLDF